MEFLQVLERPLVYRFANRHTSVAALRETQALADDDSDEPQVVGGVVALSVNASEEGIDPVSSSVAVATLLPPTLGL